MAQTAADIVAKISAAPQTPLTDKEAAVLMAETAPSLMMQKLLGVHFFQKGDHARALGWAQKVFEAEPNGESAKNVSLLLRRAGDLPRALAFTREHEALFEPVMWHDVLCMVLTQMRRFDEAVVHGTESLRLKDAAAGKAPKLTPVTRPFDREATKRNVIAFSLWGTNPRYLEGMQLNTIVAPYLYPCWTVRIYVDRSVPEPVLKALLGQGAEVRIAPPELPAGEYGLFWRFLVEEDPGVDRYLVRDADSVTNVKEAAAVEDWLASGKAFHLIRDYPAHSELILAGMWGAQRGNLTGMRARFEAHVKDGAKRLNNKITDQEFLRTEIWPVVRQDVLMHDDWFDFGQPVRMRKCFRLPSTMHIGQNDAVLRQKRQAAAK